jgi:sulfotransferase
MTYKKMFFLSGMPRSGSTLLSNIILQNKNFHIEGNSPICQLIWDINISYEKNCYQQFLANNKQYIINNIISNVLKTYYNNCEKKFIIDKCRAWTIPENTKMIKKYIDENPKIIILTRNSEDILKSFLKIGGWGDINYNLEENFFAKNSEFLRAAYGISCARQEKNKYLFIDYEEIVNDTYNVIEKIYNYLNLEYYNHDFKNITQLYQENENAYKIKDMHKIRSSIKKIENNIKISTVSQKKCNILNSLIY